MRPIDLPPQVAEIYLKDSKAIPKHECERCGYQVPVTALSEKDIKKYFPECPLCGGRTGENLWPGKRFENKAPLRIDNTLYKERRGKYHEKQIRLMCALNKDFTIERAIAILAHDIPDVRKYISQIFKL